MARSRVLSLLVLVLDHFAQLFGQRNIQFRWGDRSFKLLRSVRHAVGELVEMLEVVPDQLIFFVEFAKSGYPMRKTSTAPAPAPCSPKGRRWRALGRLVRLLKLFQEAHRAAPERRPSRQRAWGARDGPAPALRRAAQASQSEFRPEPKARWRLEPLEPGKVCMMTSRFGFVSAEQCLTPHCIDSLITHTL